MGNSRAVEEGPSKQKGKEANHVQNKKIDSGSRGDRSVPCSFACRRAGATDNRARWGHSGPERPPRHC